MTTWYRDGYRDRRRGVLGEVAVGGWEHHVLSFVDFLWHT